MTQNTNHHIPHYANHNQTIIPAGHPLVPLITFNVIELRQGESFTHNMAGYESVLVLVRGTVSISVGAEVFDNVGGRSDVFTGRADSVYVPLNNEAIITAKSADVCIYAAGGKTTAVHKPFRIKPSDIKKVQYGSDETKTHRKLHHILGQNVEGQVGNLLVSELFTVGEGGWSGFPSHKHDTERPPEETYFEEVYYFRFQPAQGFAAQFLHAEKAMGPVYHVKDKSTFIVDKGYHPVVAGPGYSMYYFTILCGKKDRSLIQYFHPDHRAQIETIPGIKDMIQAFK